MNTNLQALHEAIDALGSVAVAAPLLDRSEQAVYLYLAGKREFPAELCPRLERLTRERGRPIPCERLRPDVDWAYLRAAAGEAA
jgi:DNA-binding transcriptional regulator YdaS (Cro superfamily)